MKITKRQLNLIIENYLVTEVKMGTDRFSFTNSCDMSDIEFTKGYKALMEFIKDRKVKTVNKTIRKIEAQINNPEGVGTAAEDYVSIKISELEKHKKDLADLTEEKFGIFGIQNLSGLTSPVFQDQLMQVVGFGMLVTMGPAANLYCDLVRSIVTVVNKALDAAVGTKQKKEEYETIEFDFFYNALQRVADPIVRSLANSKQQEIWTTATEEMNISDNAMSLFKYIYCVTASQIDDTGVPAPRAPDYVDKVKDNAKRYLSQVSAGEFKIDGRGTRNVSLKQDFVDMINARSDRDILIKNLVSFIDIGNKYGARGKVSRSNFANLSQTIATKSAEEEDFYDNLIGHIKGTLNSVPG